MKIHYQPPPPPPPPLPAKPLPTSFEVEQKTKELIEAAQRERLQRLKRDKMFENKKRSAPKKASAGTNMKDKDTDNPDDPGLDILT